MVNSNTLKDIAKKLNVSVSTVSRAVNNKSYVKEETRQKVLQALKEYHYVPNEIARSLKSQSTKTIGVIIPCLLYTSADGFRMPGEFEHHDGCWILWPQRPDNWRLGGKPAQKVFVEVAKAINRFEPVTVGVNEDQYENARGMLPEEIRVVETVSYTHLDVYKRQASTRACAACK